MQNALGEHENNVTTIDDQRLHARRLQSMPRQHNDVDGEAERTLSSHDISALKQRRSAARCANACVASAGPIDVTTIATARR